VNADSVVTDPSELDDLALVAQVTQGNRSAFALLMRRYNKRLYRLARAALHDEAEAKDALQDAYVSAYRSIGQFRGDAALGTWLSRLVLNQCGARRRRNSRRDNIVPIVSLESNMHTAENVSSVDDAPDVSAARNQMRDILESKVGDLPDLLRMVFVMRSVEELSTQETADSLGITQETVRIRHFRAKALLRESLAREVDVAERSIYDFGGSHCDEMVAGVLAALDRTGP
jgi:RNA polymerase sigma-70 factor, ECF subfamily